MKQEALAIDPVTAWLKTLIHCHEGSRSNLLTGLLEPLFGKNASD